MESLEQSSVIPMFRAVKKPKSQGEQGAQGEKDNRGEDEDRGAREQAVRVIRSGVLRSLSSGRTEARMYIFRSFLFLIEKINSFDSIAAARSEGYAIEVAEAASEAETTVPDVVHDSIWDIPRTLLMATLRVK